MKWLPLISGIIVLVLSITSLFYVHIPFNSILDYCETNCRNPMNHSEDCGSYTRLPNCNDEDAPNKTIFGTDNPNKLGWCYDHQGGRCGWMSTMYFAPVLYVIPLAYAGVGLAIIVSAFINKKGCLGFEEKTK